MLSYFGCDQSQVQRYLTAKSVEEGRDSLMMSAFVKIPLQALVLLTGVLVFVFYLFNQPPMLFNTVHAEKSREERAGGGVPRSSRREFTAAFEARRTAAAAAGCGRRRRATSRRARRSTRPTARSARSARARPQTRPRGHRRRAVQGSDGRYAGARRQLRLSDVRHDAAAARPRRPDHRRHLRGGDVVHRRRAQLAGDRRASSTSTAGC